MENILINPSDEREILDFRALGFRDGVVLGRYAYAQARKPLDSHDHERLLEICYLADGRQVYEMDGRTYTLEGGDAFLVAPHRVHGTGELPEGKGRLYWLLLAPPKRRGTYLGLSEEERLQLWERLIRFADSRDRPPVVRIGACGDLVLERVFQVFANEEHPFREAEIRNLILRFLFDLINAMEQPISRVSEAVRRAVKFIDNRPDHMFQVSELATEAGLSPSRFKARFRDEMGVSPADYMLRQKINHAKRLLCDDSLSITSIAFSLGFSSSQYFSTVFKRYTGQRPRDFRKQESKSRSQ
jgi:AraC-like DNA-binding protein